MTIRPVGTEVFHAGERTEQANSRLSQFCGRA